MDEVVGRSNYELVYCHQSGSWFSRKYVPTTFVGRVRTPLMWRSWAVVQAILVHTANLQLAHSQVQEEFARPVCLAPHVVAQSLFRVRTAVCERQVLAQVALRPLS
mgnify:CR=1 FL=1